MSQLPKSEQSRSALSALRLDWASWWVLRSEAISVTSICDFPFGRPRRSALRMLVMAISCCRNLFRRNAVPNPRGAWRIPWELLLCFVLIPNLRDSPSWLLFITWLTIPCLPCGHFTPNTVMHGAAGMSDSHSLSSACVRRWFPGFWLDQSSNALANAVAFSPACSSGSWDSQVSLWPFAAGSFFRSFLLSRFGASPHLPFNR